MTPALGAEVLIDKLIPEGKGLGRLADGRVVIAAGALPGDRIALEAVKESKGLVTAERFSLLEASAARVAPSCEVADRCGGCDLMSLGIAEQRRHKLAMLREALLRTGKIDWGARPLPLVAGERAEGYRGRLRLQIAGGRIGFFHRQSHELVEAQSCRVGTPRLNAALGQIREAARAAPAGLDAFAWLEVREASDGSVSVLLEPRGRGLSAAARGWLAALAERGFRVSSTRDAGTSPELLQRFELTTDTYLLSAPRSFVQVNWEVNQALIARVLEGAAGRGLRTFLDAYAGAGNFSLPLLRQGLTGLAVESNEAAVAAARRAASQQGLDPAAFVAADAAEHALGLARAGRRFDLVLVDPPRAGLTSGLEPLSRLAARALALCSCNPVTLARDLARLLALGFELEELQAFDMFPQTHHLETLAWLRAPGAGGGERQITAQSTSSV